MASSFYEPLSLQDGSFIVFEGPGTHMHVSAVGVFEPGAATGGALDIERLRQHVASHLHRLPRYRQRLDFTPLQGHPIWIDDPRFNLLYHVRHTALPQPGSEEQLKALAARILSQQLDREKPLWEMWFVEGLEGGRFALISKIHHCMADGVRGIGLLSALLTSQPEPDVAAPRSWSPRPRPGTLGLVRDEVVRRITTPLSALQALRRATQRPVETSAVLARDVDALWQALRSGFHVPANTPLNRPIGTHRRIDWRVLDLAELKRLKKELGVTVNDVVLAVVTGAVRSFLGRRRTPLDGLDFRIVVPVNMRSGSEASQDGNRVSAWFVSLPVEEPDPRHRLARIRRETEQLRRSRTAQGFELFTRLTEWTGSETLARLGVRFAASMHPYNMIVTNVPGPRKPLYLLDARLEALYPQLPLFEHQGLGVAVLSYLDRVCFGVISDWDVVPDLAEFAADLDTAFDELRRSAA